AGLAGVDASRLEAQTGASIAYIAPRPLYTALHSERAMLLPSLDDALGRFLHQRGEPMRDEAACYPEPVAR
ncbi:MAG: hypothetical protein ACXW24_20410, partial [Telluria sp.]